MPFVVKDKVAVTTTSTGIGNIVLGSAITGFQNFSVIGDGNQTHYGITDGTNWETGIGTVLDNWSNFFDGTGDFLSLSNNDALNPGTDDFAMEAWVYITGTTGNNQGINGKGTSGTDGYSFFVTNSLQLRFVWDGVGGATITGGTLSLNTWHHVAVVRNDNVIRLYLDGVGALSSTACTTNITSTAVKYIGQARGGNPILGYISNYRMTEGLRPAGYDATLSSLTVPTLALTSISGTSLLTCQSSTFRDNSPNNFAITRTGQVTSNNSIIPFSYNNTLSRDVVLSSTYTPVESWSNYFDGQNDSIFTPASSNLALTSSDFTIELWYYATGRLTATPSLINNGNFGINKWQINDRHSFNPTKVAFHAHSYAPSAHMLVSKSTVTAGRWYHVAVTRSGSTFKLYLDGVLEHTVTFAGSITAASDSIYLGRDAGQLGSSYTGYISNARIVRGSVVYTDNFTPPLNPLSSIPNTVLLTCQDSTFLDNSPNNFSLSVTETPRVDQFDPFYRKQVNWGAGTKNVTVPFIAENTTGVLPEADNNTIGNDLTAWYNLEKQLDHGVLNGVPYRNNNTNGVVSTYSLIYTTSTAFRGGVLAPNGDIHFVPYFGARGQKVSSSGVVSTYALVYTLATGAYAGGVLAPNGDIQLIPYSATVGQKINASGLVSTYSLVYTTTIAYTGGVLAPNGDVHFVPTNAVRGQKISASGLVSTYSLVSGGTYAGGALAPNGDIHFVPASAVRGQKVSSIGVVSTYPLVYTVANAYAGGVLAPNGDIHFIPSNAGVGQKVSIDGIVSTYSLVYTVANAYAGGVLAPNGDIHFIPQNAVRGQKVSSTGVVSTYSLVYTVANGYIGGVLTPTGEINFIPLSGAVAQKVSTGAEVPIGYCLSPFFNKF